MNITNRKTDNNVFCSQVLITTAGLACKAHDTTYKRKIDGSSVAPRVLGD